MVFTRGKPGEKKGFKRMDPCTCSGEGGVSQGRNGHRKTLKEGVCKLEEGVLKLKKRTTLIAPREKKGTKQ